MNELKICHCILETKRLTHLKQKQNVSGAYQFPCQNICFIQPL